MYTIELTKQAQKQLYKLNKEFQRRIIITLERIRIRPYSHVKKLVGGPYFKLRVGDYRLILKIRNKELIILVIEIDHRRRIYKVVRRGK